MSLQAITPDYQGHNGDQQETAIDIPALIDKLTIATDNSALARILTALGPDHIDRPTRVAFVNAHALNLCHKDKEFLRCLLESDYVFRDGSGMKILYKMLRRDPGLNLNGTDLIPQIVEIYRGCNAALLGTSSYYAERAAEVIRKKQVGPVLVMDGFQDEQAYIEAAQKQPASLIILAMGMPRQERVAALLAEKLSYPCLIICGGAILDFLGGKVTRAPVIFRRCGMEWLYRLALEPKRLFRRYMIGNVLFLFRGALMAAKKSAKQA